MNSIASPNRADAGLARGRSNTYGFLAQCFLTEPQDSLVRTARQALCLLADMDEGSLSGAMRHIRQEYYDRFFVPASGRYVPPFESAVAGRTVDQGKTTFGSLMGPESHEVAAAYDAVGFDPWELALYAPLRSIRLPDHVGFELAFMAYQQFLERHLSRWMSDYAALTAGCGSGFYAGVASAAAAWVQADLDQFESGSWGKGELS